MSAPVVVVFVVGVVVVGLLVAGLLWLRDVVADLTDDADGWTR